MAREVERIEQDLAALEEAIALLKVDFQSTYVQYLKLLGQAVRQQLILASYQICTQGYPESFLSLSFNQRQHLQQEVQKLAGLVREELVAHSAPKKPVPEFEGEIEEASELVNSEPVKASLSQPEQLLEWQEQVEKAIAQTLKTLSLDTNRLLKKNGIIPDKLPSAVLEAAVQVEASTEATAGSPNLLNLLMEAENEQDEKEDSTLMRIVAINLRLSEIEFADPALNAGRNQIRKLSARVSSFQREYHNKQRERAVAQAEAAWRSSWFEE